MSIIKIKYLFEREQASNNLVLKSKTVHVFGLKLWERNDHEELKEEVKEEKQLPGFKYSQRD